MEYLVFEDIENENFNINTDFVSISSTGNIEPVKKKGARLQHYRPAWELNPLFEKWLVQGNNSRRAKCIVCNSQLTADISALKYHASSMKHREAMTQEFGDVFIPKSSSVKAVKRGFYNQLWESDEKYGSWIMQGSSELYAYCRLCKLDIPANTSTLKRHMFTQTHIKASDFDEKLHTLQSLGLSGESIVLQNLNGTIEDHDQEVAKLHEICLSANLSNAEIPHSFTEVAAPTTIFQYTNNRGKLMDELSLQIGKLLLRGYKMLNESCRKCECVLMESKKGIKTCVGCQSGIMEEFKVKPNTEGANAFLPPVKYQVPINLSTSPDMILGRPYEFPICSFDQEDASKCLEDNSSDVEEIVVKEEIDDSAPEAEIVLNEAEDGEMNFKRVYRPEQTMKSDEDSNYLTSMMNGQKFFQKGDLPSKALALKRVLTNLVEQLERNENISNSLKSIDTTVTALVKLKNCE